MRTTGFRRQLESLALLLFATSAVAQETPLTVEELAAERWLREPPFVLTEMFSADLPGMFLGSEQVELAAKAKPVEVGELTELEVLGPNKYRIKLALAEAGFEEQRNDEWCWAACARMVNEFNRRGCAEIPSPSQETLAQYFKGGEEFQEANVSTIMRALCLDLEEQHRRNIVTVGADFVDTAPSRLVDDLSRGSMPIVGLVSAEGQGHAVVVTGLTYSWTESGKQARRLREKQEDLEELEGFVGGARDLLDASKGKRSDHRKDKKVSDRLDDVGDVYEAITDAYVIESVTMLDPWSAEDPELTLSGEEFRQQLSFVLTREIALELLTAGADGNRRTLGDELDKRGLGDLKDKLGGWR